MHFLYVPWYLKESRQRITELQIESKNAKRLNRKHISPERSVTGCRERPDRRRNLELEASFRCGEELWSSTAVGDGWFSVRPWMWTWNESERFIGRLSCENLGSDIFLRESLGWTEVPLESNPDMLNDFAWKVRCITTKSQHYWQCISMYHKIRTISCLGVNWKASGSELDLCSGGSSQGLWVRGCFQCADATAFRNCLQPINLPRCVLWQTCFKICGLECRCNAMDKVNWKCTAYMFSTCELFYDMFRKHHKTV